MIIINKEYLRHFYLSGKTYLYLVHKGIYLSFDKDTLEYKGVELYYIPFDFKSYQKACDDTLNRLISKGILEII